MLGVELSLFFRCLNTAFKLANIWCGVDDVKGDVDEIIPHHVTCRIARVAWSRVPRVAAARDWNFHVALG